MSSVRETMLKEAIGKAETPTLAAVAALLPADFDLDEAEFSAAVQPVAPEEPVAVESQIVELDAELVLLRQAARVKRNEIGAARTALADAIRVVNANGRTPESVARDVIAANQREKQAIADGHGAEPARPTPGDSHLDRIRSGSRGHCADRGYGAGPAGRIINTPWGPQRTGKYGGRVT